MSHIKRAKGRRAVMYDAADTRAGGVSRCSPRDGLRRPVSPSADAVPAVTGLRALSTLVAVEVEVAVDVVFNVQ